MVRAGVAVAPYGAFVVELLADNADPKAGEVYQAIRTQYGVPTLVALESPAEN